MPELLFSEMRLRTDSLILWIWNLFFFGKVFFCFSDSIL